MTKGHWVDIEARWFEQRMTYCALCGRVVPKRIWRAARADGHVADFCCPECAELDARYGHAAGDRPAEPAVPNPR